jgi:L-ribulose-5-phosphate 3-epimerase
MPDKKTEIDSRREFLNKCLATFITLQGAQMFKPARLSAVPGIVKDDISLAQWALVDEIREGKWKTLDFPKIARKDFDINGIEFVNTLFESPTYDYLKQLRENASAHGVAMVLIMVDGEGETCSPSKEERSQTVVNHRKWIDIANFLGCHAIRTNCRGPEGADKGEALKWASDTYHQMLEYAIPANIGLCIENHGGVSNDADWMIALMKSVDNRYFGTYPDWRGPSAAFDNYGYLKKTLPWAMGMSYRNQPDEETSAKMIRLCRDSGYRGWYGIESSGRDAILEGKRILKKYLMNS